MANGVLFPMLLSFILVGIASGEVILNSYDEIDPVIDMLLNGEYDNAMESKEQVDRQDYQEEGVQNVPMLYPGGIWKCGNCTNMDHLRLLYSEAFDQYTNYEEYGEKLNLEIQIGLSLSGMRCITMSADEDIDVRLASGACAGDQATLGVTGAVHCTVSIYG